jgi:hypothetical protein
MGPASQLGFTGRAQPIVIKQLKFDPTIWKTYVWLLEEVQSRNFSSFLSD